MMDRLFLATLTLGVFAAGTLTIAASLFGGALDAPVPLVQLDPVVVSAKRLTPPDALAATERVEPATRRAQ